MLPNMLPVTLHYSLSNLRTQDPGAALLESACCVPNSSPTIVRDLKCTEPGSCACLIAQAPTQIRSFTFAAPAAVPGYEVQHFPILVISGGITHECYILWAICFHCFRCLCLPTHPYSSGKPSEAPPCLLQALGLAADMSAGIMGKRTRRFAMYVNDGTVSA